MTRPWPNDLRVPGAPARHAERSLSPGRRNARPRNAAAAPTVQVAVRALFGALASAYGYRPDWAGVIAIPYVSLPFAAELVRILDGEAERWLRAPIPDEARQPGFIRRWLGQLHEVAGVQDGKTFAPVLASYESAPARITEKAPPSFFPAGSPGAQAPKLVLKAAATWAVYDAAIRLAIHFDALAGAPTRMHLLLESFGQVGSQIAHDVYKAGRDFARGVEQAPAAVGTALKWGALSAAGLAAFYLLYRVAGRDE
jgi:hypothetical protein